MPSYLKPPFSIALLTLPYGIAVGWVSVSLPTGLILHGFAPVQAGLLIAPALSLYLWRILPGVLVDRTLSFRSWLRFGMALTALGVLPFLWWPLVPGRDGGMAWVIGVSQAGAMLLLLGATGYLLRGTGEHAWGRAAGWFHFGILAGLWLSLPSPGGKGTHCGGPSWRPFRWNGLV